MNLIIILIALILLMLFRKDWKKGIYFLVFMVPFLGFIQLRIMHLSNLAPLLHDFIIFPLYIIFFAYAIKNKNKKFFIPENFNKFFVFFILLIMIQVLNPNDLNIVAKLIGIKVWIFYFLFLYIGFEFIENELELKKFCKFFVLIAIIPCVIAIILYLSSYFIDYRQTILFFQGYDETAASASTQRFGKSDWGAGVKIFRIQILYLFVSNQLKKIIYPKGVFVLKYDQNPIDNKFVASIISFIYMYYFQKADFPLLFPEYG